MYFYVTSSDPYAECLVKFFLFFSSFCSDLFHTCTTHNDALWIYIVLRHCFDVHVLGTIMAVITDRNFVDKCSQQVMHFDHEATY